MVYLYSLLSARNFYILLTIRHSVVNQISSEVIVINIYLNLTFLAGQC